MPDTRNFPEGVSDHAVLTTVLTALLVRAGGQLEFSPEEWGAAVEHEGSLFFHKDHEDEALTVVLMQKVVHT